MAYVQGFVTAVPAADKAVYLAFAEKTARLFKEWGATRVVETWGDDVPAGELTDFQRAVQAKPDEVVVFSWIEYPDKATCQAAGERMMTDPEMAAIGDMPFDGKRMIYGGFELILDA